MPKSKRMPRSDRDGLELASNHLALDLHVALEILVVGATDLQLQLGHEVDAETQAETVGAAHILGVPVRPEDAERAEARSRQQQHDDKSETQLPHQPHVPFPLSSQKTSLVPGSKNPKFCWRDHTGTAPDRDPARRATELPGFAAALLDSARFGLMSTLHSYRTSGRGQRFAEMPCDLRPRPGPAISKGKGEAHARQENPYSVSSVSASCCWALRRYSPSRDDP